MADDEIIAKDLPEYVATLQELNNQVGEMSKHVGGFVNKIDDKEITTEKGISFLEVKSQLLLSYLINIVYYMLLKAEGKKIEDEPAIDRLVEIRTVLEKLRPIDQKMKYQIDKLVKMATTGLAVGDNDPLRFKPNPENMSARFDDDDDEDSDDDDETAGTPSSSKPGVYVPPKVTAVPYDDGGKSRRERDIEHAKKRALSSSLIHDLRDEFSDAPLEIREESVKDWRSVKQREDDSHRQRYEEDNFIRLQTKKQKRSNPRHSGPFDELTSFTDLSVLSDNFNGDESSQGRRSSTGKGKKSKWKRKSGSAKKKRMRRR